MKIISRAEARALGLQYFYTGIPCKHGHCEGRYVANSHCSECTRLAQIRLRSGRPLLATYNGMLYRSTNENSPDYEDYGGRGITVCDRWLDPVEGYDNFVTDMGPRPEGFSLDRIDFDGNYEPSNCRWADAVTQQRNKRNTKLKGEDVVKAYNLLDAGMRLCDVAKVYSCTSSAINHIRRKREQHIEQGLGRCTKTAAR